jgi:hypothetical protein
MLYLRCSKLISIFRPANFCQFFDRKFLSVLPFTKKLLMIRCSQGATMAIGGAIIRVCPKSFSWGVGCGVWGVGFYREKYGALMSKQIQPNAYRLFIEIPQARENYWDEPQRYY